MYLVFRSYGLGPFVWVANNFFQFMVSALIFATLQSLAVYMMSFGKDKLLALGGNSGYFAYDFFIGRELNPQFMGVDIKYFCELRPGLIGWAFLNLCFIAKQYSRFHFVSNSILIVSTSQIVYVLDSLWFERAVLTTMDITTEGFGWMLSMGDLCWVPSLYTLQARYLSFYPLVLTNWYALLVSTLSLFSYLLFRLSNYEKNEFRSNPNSSYVKNLKFIETKAGSRLLVSGWWGLARHINYTGDWFLGLSQCMATGFDTPLTYTFSIYFLTLLLHRNYRDEHKCKTKYGKDWDRYCGIVKYKFIPYVY
ncbi:hypothetical protein BB559_005524 [Furculomyces boomerangus]|uniref:Steroid 5-alpha reductase C-terminal domain-containing protein n=2 Tax=Harpellales TaxID=61421 RepID=A0A2T9Y8B4_9FUNG|nr:hypothetical protein BB559_005524 [Furculomyces boomerangus]PVZ97545.1 hypothetical protein BB558_006490 [Smittium angustum]